MGGFQEGIRGKCSTLLPSLSLEGQVEGIITRILGKPQQTNCSLAGQEQENRYLEISCLFFQLAETIQNQRAREPFNKFHLLGHRSGSGRGKVNLQATLKVVWYSSGFPDAFLRQAHYQFVRTFVSLDLMWHLITISRDITLCSIIQSIDLSQCSSNGGQCACLAKQFYFFKNQAWVDLSKM